jgi:uncharacterized repeat protein (TIGR03803 family)
MANPVPGKKPIRAPLMRWLCAATLLLPVFGARASGVLTTLYTFPGTTNGANPNSLMLSTNGWFYGTTQHGGYGGTVFKINTNGAWARLYAFTNGLDNSEPQGALVQGDDGDLYGTTSGVSVYYGSVFKITTNGTLTTLYLFTNQINGSEPAGPLVKGSDGWFYGTTFYGGTNGAGNVFKISPNSAFTNLYSFPRGSDTDGENPYGAMVQASDGYLYGTAYGGGANSAGSIFKISTNGILTTLHVFSQIPDGADPDAGLILASDGWFYGTTQFGGLTAYAGSVFKISASGAFPSVYSFGTGDSAYPEGIVQGGDGYFYGTTGVDQPGNSGTVFRLGTNGTLTTLYSFTGGDDGGEPSGLIRGADGCFYGVTYNGGTNSAGTVFRLSIVPDFQASTMAGSALNLTWSTEPGGMYQLQYNSSLNSSNWTNLGSSVAATGTTLNTTDTVTSVPHRFYRLVLLP